MAKAVVAICRESALRLVEKPRATAGHVVVRIVLRAVNPLDLWLVKLKCAQLESVDFSDAFSAMLRNGRQFVPGSDGMGYVEEVGEGVTKVKVGQRVVPSFLQSFYRRGDGSWQDYIVVPEEQVFLLPDSIQDEIAVQYLENPCTAYTLLKDIGISEGGYLLQTTHGSMLGRMVIQLAKHWGIKTINIVGNDNMKQELKDMGADEVINWTTENVQARVTEITGGNMAECGVDFFSGILTKIAASGVKTGGRLLVIESFGGSNDSIFHLSDLGQVNIESWNFSMFMATKGVFERLAEDVIELLESRVITPLPGKRFKMENFRQAIEESEKYSNGAKVMLTS